MKIKKGDTVKIIAGKDRGKTGKVLQAFPALARVSVEGCNIAVKHLRSGKRGVAGQRIEFPSPIHVSSVMLIAPSSGKPVRVGYAVNKETGKKIRIAKKISEPV
ncbi:MAG: 50S ribosomal protein L24 [Parcubacteria group bacterium]|nr:50S ribosomal protein L24 [Parcubacteria group bacterium]